MKEMGREAVPDVAWNWRNETCFQLTMKERGVEEAAVLFPTHAHV
jgi:hypothetical protein